jgi:DNA-binding LytR/AlgR family response regulator
MNTPKVHRCLIVDDEPIARKIIKNYIDQLPVLVCAGECKNAFEAIEIINRDEGIEIIFLDINMPNISGISMVKILPKPPLIIFTTAYSEYAVESYELNAIDYLLKPFLLERFAKAVFKATERLKESAVQHEFEINTPAQIIYIKSDGEKYPVLLSDILYCEAMKNYTKIVLVNGKTYLPLVPLSKFETELNQISPHFLRIHRSFILSKLHIDAIGANHVMVNNNKLPIGDLYKDVFLNLLGMKQ